MCHHRGATQSPSRAVALQACVQLVLQGMRLPGPALSPLTAPLQGVLNRLAADLPAGRLHVHLCPRIAMTAEPPGAVLS